MGRRALWVTVLPSVGLAFALLMAGVTTLTGVSPRRLLPGLPDPAVPDYARAPTAFSRLDPRYIQRVLGDFIDFPTSGVQAPTGRSLGGVGTPPDLERVIDVHSLVNDDLANARVIPRLPFTAKTNATGATREQDEPADCGSLGGSVWYRYTPGRAGGLIANTVGTQKATTLGIFTGSPSGLHPVGCDSDIGGNALYAFAADQDMTYYFQIMFPAGAGDLVFNLESHTTTTESLSPAGTPGDGGSEWPSISADGDVVVFSTIATNLTAGVDATPCVARDPDASLREVVRLPPVFIRQLGTDPCMQVVAHDRRSGTTDLVSKSSSGVPGNSFSFDARLSGNGRYVAFASEATNLVPRDTNRLQDIFVHDLRTGRTERISVSSREEQMSDDGMGMRGAHSPSISDDGRYVAFVTEAPNLVENDTNDGPDVFVRDRLRGTTTRISVSSAGEQTERFADRSYLLMRNASAFGVQATCISPDGRYVAFTSAAANLVAGDRNEVWDAFVHDRRTRRTVRISVSLTGEEGNGESRFTRGGCFSRDGRYVVFNSVASNLVPDDTNQQWDVFVHDVRTGTNLRANVSSSGAQSNGLGEAPIISGDGRYVAFYSSAPDLVPGDTNGRDDVFVHDLVTRSTIRVSLSAGGEELADGSSVGPAMSADGRSIAYFSTISQAISIDGLGSLVPCVCASWSLTPSQVYVYEPTGGSA